MDEFLKRLGKAGGWNNYGAPVLIGVASNVLAVFALVFVAEVLPTFFYKQIDRSIAVFMILAVSLSSLYLRRHGRDTLVAGLLAGVTICAVLFAWLTWSRPWCPDATINGARIEYQAEQLASGVALPVVADGPLAVLTVPPDVGTVIIRARAQSQFADKDPLKQELFDCDWQQDASITFRPNGCNAQLTIRQSPPPLLQLTMSYPPCRIDFDRPLVVKVQPPPP